jgi:hypothetical protein
MLHALSIEYSVIDQPNNTPVPCYMAMGTNCNTPRYVIFTNLFFLLLLPSLKSKYSSRIVILQVDSVIFPSNERLVFTFLWLWRMATDFETYDQSSTWKE